MIVVAYLRMTNEVVHDRENKRWWPNRVTKKVAKDPVLRVAAPKMVRVAAAPKKNPWSRNLSVSRGGAPITPTGTRTDTGNGSTLKRGGRVRTTSGGIPVTRLGPGLADILKGKNLRKRTAKSRTRELPAKAKAKTSNPPTLNRASSADIQELASKKEEPLSGTLIRATSDVPKPAAVVNQNPPPVVAPLLIPRTVVVKRTLSDPSKPFGGVSDDHPIKPSRMTQSRTELDAPNPATPADGPYYEYDTDSSGSTEVFTPLDSPRDEKTPITYPAFGGVTSPDLPGDGIVLHHIHTNTDVEEQDVHGGQNMETLTASVDTGTGHNVESASIEFAHRETSATKEAHKTMSGPASRGGGNGGRGRGGANSEEHYSDQFPPLPDQKGGVPGVNAPKSLRQAHKNLRSNKSRKKQQGQARKKQQQLQRQKQNQTDAEFVSDSAQRALATAASVPASSTRPRAPAAGARTMAPPPAAAREKAQGATQNAPEKRVTNSRVPAQTMQNVNYFPSQTAAQAQGQNYAYGPTQYTPYDQGEAQAHYGVQGHMHAMAGEQQQVVHPHPTQQPPQVGAQRPSQAQLNASAFMAAQGGFGAPQGAPQAHAGPAAQVHAQEQMFPPPKKVQVERTPMNLAAAPPGARTRIHRQQQPPPMPGVQHQQQDARYTHVMPGVGGGVGVGAPMTDPLALSPRLRARAVECTFWFFTEYPIY